MYFRSDAPANHALREIEFNVRSLWKHAGMVWPLDRTRAAIAALPGSLDGNVLSQGSNQFIGPDRPSLEVAFLKFPKHLVTGS